MGDIRFSYIRYVSDTYDMSLILMSTPAPGVYVNATLLSTKY